MKAVASEGGAHQEGVLSRGNNHQRDGAALTLSDEDEVATAHPLGLARVVEGGGHVSHPAHTQQGRDGSTGREGRGGRATRDGAGEEASGAVRSWRKARAGGGRRAPVALELREQRQPLHAQRVVY